MKMSNNLFVLTEQEEYQTPYEWDDMPEFVQEDNDAYATISVRFRCEEDLRKFANLVEQVSITEKTKSIWYPILERNAASLSRWIDGSESESEVEN